MKAETTSKQEAKLRKRPNPGSDKARSRKWRTMGSVLLCLLGLSATVRNARSDVLMGTNATPITIPDSGAGSPYPSSIVFGGFGGTITNVQVALLDVSHTFPADIDILLVGPGGQYTNLMSDCGSSFDLNNVILVFDDTGGLMPDAFQINPGSYRPSNHGGPTDTFPPNPPQSFPSSMSVFNNTSPNGTWSLYVFDDAGGDIGSIAGGWQITIYTTAFQYGGTLMIPPNQSPYPSTVTVGALPASIKKTRVRLTNITHTFPDDIDILLVGPGGQDAIIMSDVGGDPDISNVTLVLDDDAANSLPDDGPLTSGIFKPTNIGTGDTFPVAPPPSGGSALSVFNNANPNGTWSLYVLDDSGGNTGSMARWNVEFDLFPTVLANISSRMRVETGDNVLIGGFIVTGTQPKKVIVRAIGPSLPFAGKLANPTLELRDGNSGLIRFNDNWRSGSQGFPSQEAEIIATGIPPTNDLESAIVATLPANGAGYTAIVHGANSGTGIGVVEAYDLDRAVDSKLANVSTRGLVQTGDNVLIAGTIVLGFTAERVIVRALGPSLIVAGKLADPTLELRDGNGGLIAFNDDWQDNQEADIIASTIPPTADFESAIVATLPSAGAGYTAIVRGINGTTGIAVVEVYALN